jgi:DNA-binding transcriptional LysR family regulator
MNPFHLRTFLAVRKHLNYTRAAEAVFLSQPAVSRQIRQLEEELGVRLFEQIGKSLHLTDAGRTLGAEAEKLLGAMDRAAEVVRAHRSAELGSLRIGASTTPGFYLLPSLLGRFHHQFPKAELHYFVGNSLHIEQMVARNELDLGFVGAHLSNEDLRLVPVVEDEIVCFASPTHPLARQRQVSPRELERETWVIREKGSATREVFEAWLSRHGAKMRKAIELGCPEVVKALVAAGLGVSFISIHGLIGEVPRKRFRRIPVTGLRLRRPIYLVRHASKHDSPTMEAFLEIMRAEFATYGTSARLKL